MEPSEDNVPQLPRPRFEPIPGEDSGSVKPSGERVVKLVNGPRLSMVGNLYHQNPGEQPTGVNVRFARPLKTSEQPFIRHITIDKGWQPVPFGWLEVGNVGHVHIENIGKALIEVGYDIGTPPAGAIVKGKDRTMFDEQPAATVPNTISIFPSHYVYPGEGHGITPIYPGLLRVRAHADGCRCVITVFPQ